MNFKQLADFYNLYNAYYYDELIIFDASSQEEIYAWWLDEFANTLSLY